jgi:dienelactone hydrolase
MSIMTSPVEYEEGGRTFEGLAAVDESHSGSRPAIMVCHAWGGRKEHEEQTARKLAELGYLGFAADVYGKGVRGDSIEENQELMTPLVEDRDGLQRRLRAALDAMMGLEHADSARTAVAGYCFGGLCALDMARTNAPVKGVAAFHAVIGKPGKPGGDDIKPKVIAFQGYDDPMADKDAQRDFADEMTERKADWQLHLFGGVSHAFTNKGADNDELGLRYDAQADARSWAGFERFLKELFG